MTKSVWKKAATVVLGASLVGGVLVELPNPLTTTQAQAATTSISYSDFKDDENAAKEAVKLGSPSVQKIVNSKFFANMEKDPVSAYNVYKPYSFTAVMSALGNDGAKNYDSKGNLAGNSSKDWAAMQSLSDHFSGRFSSNTQAGVQSAYQAVIDHNGKNDGEKDYGLAGYAIDFQDSFQTTFDVKKITGMPASTKKSYISKLSVKKTSKKYVKVTGSAKLYKSAKYARVHTYKGNKYTKLSSKHTFSKSVYAPKAKTVKVTVGNYSHGHFSSVTSTKTVHVK
ncbi:hypothetical protein IWT25_00346 [Secundilactobacillus pentosiphilus]|uniref:Uncharacterized protein n=1 Tax=Secundilactobacillus pentosiphilus TaxID=1714682 RepID=A0A1Z5ITF3_9LACO|nr:hypothetical protein [Secundilactobacillus pentosiphilus]GAX05043.1 hypothetical protein IWT25_00346 [Secundilactobacillus pentosiphilus]